jgi:hypothetical protein
MHKQRLGVVLTVRIFQTDRFGWPGRVLIVFCSRIIFIRQARLDDAIDGNGLTLGVVVSDVAYL